MLRQKLRQYSGGRGQYQLDEGCNVQTAAVFTDIAAWVSQRRLRFGGNPARASQPSLEEAYTKPIQKLLEFPAKYSL